LHCTLKVMMECRGNLPGEKVVVQDGPVETGRTDEGGGKCAVGGSDIKPVIREAVI